jgi:hypothetical protein
MFGGWTVCQGRNARGSIVRVAVRGATFLAALDRDCGAGPLPPSEPSSNGPIASSSVSSLRAATACSLRDKNNAPTERHQSFGVGNFNALILSVNNSCCMLHVPCINQMYTNF